MLQAIRAIDTMDWEPSDEVRAEAEKNLEELMSDFQYKYLRSIVVWCPTDQLWPDFVATLLGKYDTEVKIHNHWVSPGAAAPPLVKVWRGAVAEFCSPLLAMTAAKEIRSRYRSLRVVMFEQLIDILREAELRYPIPPGKASAVVICAPRTFEDCHIDVLKSALNLFGKPKKVVLYRNRSSNGVVAKVRYPTQLQAYAARTALNGMRLDGFGHVATQADSTRKKGGSFDEFVRERFRQLAHDS